MTQHDNTLLLVAAVALQAWRDAQAGSNEAAAWLDTVAPDWREWRPPQTLAIGARARMTRKNSRPHQRKAQSLARESNAKDTSRTPTAAICEG